jgi:hypothetical protein
MFSESHHEIMWEEVDELERMTHSSKATMAGALFNGTGEYFLNILPRRLSMDTG